MENTVLNQLTRSLLRHQKVLRNAKQNETLHFAVKRLVNFINSNINLRGIIAELKGKADNINDIKNAAHLLIGNSYGQELRDFDSESEFILRSYFVLELCLSGSTGIEHSAARALCRDRSNENERFEKIQSILVDPVIDYLIDELDSQKYILSNLLRYKQKIEWFNRSKLQKIINEEKKKGDTNNRIENILNLGIYEHLQDKGVEFYLEAVSAESRGRVDLIGAQGSSPHLLLDGKYLENSSQAKSQIREAFWQVFKYTQQYDRKFGYVICFKNIENKIIFDFPESGYSIPSVVLEGKTIFFIVIDIFYRGSTPSQKSKSNDIVIKQDELLKKDREIRV